MAPDEYSDFIRWTNLMTLNSSVKLPSREGFQLVWEFFNKDRRPVQSNKQ